MPVSDLFTDALIDTSSVTDDDLVVATMCVQPQPTPTAAEAEAGRLVRFAHLARSAETAELILERAFTLLHGHAVLTALALHAGFEETAWRVAHPDARHQTHAASVDALSGPLRDLVVSCVLRSFARLGTTDGVLEMCALEESIRLTSDAELLVPVVKRGTTLHADVAITRLFSLKARATISDVIPHVSGNKRTRLVEVLTALGPT